MKANISKEKIELFDRVIHEIKSAIKNAVLYDHVHPLFTCSIKNLKIALDNWFSFEKKLYIGISPNNVLLNGDYVREENELYEEVAGYMHERGIVALFISKGVETYEVMELFEALRKQTKAVRENKGMLMKFQGTAHIEVKKVDYSSLLGSTEKGITIEEKELWKNLAGMGEKLEGGVLPESKVEFLVDFLKDHSKAAAVLNGVYKDAVAKLEDGRAAGDIHGVIARICEHFEKRSDSGAKEVKGDLAHIVAQLHPDLVAKLFERTTYGTGDFDLARKITEDFSDDFIAGLIWSLITREDTINETLLRVFDKLAPGKNKAGNVASIVTDKLLYEKKLNTDTLSKLQVSINDMFNTHPDSNFMAQMYGITVETFINKKTDRSIYVNRLSPLVKEYMNFAGGSNPVNEKMRLLLNILWLEDDPAEFKKVNAILTGLLPKILKTKDVKCIRDIFELFFEKLRSEQKENIAIGNEIKRTIDVLTAEKLIKCIIGFIPETTDENLGDIAYVFMMAGKDAANLLMDTFSTERDQLRRHKYTSILAGMDNTVSAEIANRLEYSDPGTVRSLFKILRVADPQKARLAAKNLICHNDVEIRLEGLEAFTPETDEEKETVISVVEKDQDERVRNRAVYILLQTGDRRVLDKLFNNAGIRSMGQELLLKLVELCGQMRIKESFPYLEKIFSKRIMFSSSKTDELRIAALVSLGRLRTDEAMKLIETGRNDKRSRVRNMCKIILELDNSVDNIPPSDEGARDVLH